MGKSSAKRILIPINHCGNIIAGVTDLSLGKLVQSAIEELVNVKIMHDLRFLSAYFMKKYVKNNMTEKISVRYINKYRHDCHEGD